MHPRLGEGGALRTKKVESLQRGAVRARNPGAHVQGQGRRGPPTPSSPFLFFFLQARGGVLLVSPPPSPPPRGESARGSAAAAIFPPLRTHGARGRSAAAPPPPSPGPGKGQPCSRYRRPPAPAFAADIARQPPGPGLRCRPGARPTAAAALAFCFLRSGAPAPARALQGTQRAPPAGPGKAAARARACVTDPSSSPCARAPLGCAPAPPGGREGRWQERLREGRTSLLAHPPRGRPRRGGGPVERREECRIQQGWGQLCGRWCALQSRQSDPGRGRVRSAHLRDYRARGRHVWGV